MELFTIALTQVINDFEGLIRNMDGTVKVVIVSVCVILGFIGAFVLDENDDPDELIGGGMQ